MTTPIGALLAEGSNAECANEPALVVWSSKEARVAESVTFAQVRVLKLLIYSARIAFNCAATRHPSPIESWYIHRCLSTSACW